MHRLTIHRAVAAAIPLERFRALAELLAQSGLGLDWHPGHSSFIGSITSDLVARLLSILAADGYMFWSTTAPRTFDFDDTCELISSTNWRLVAIRTTVAQFQIDRYSMEFYS
jgi:hypothetical protein